MVADIECYPFSKSLDPLLHYALTVQQYDLLDHPHLKNQSSN